MGEHSFEMTMAFRTRLAAILALALAFSLLAIPASKADVGQQNPQAKVWTNADLDQLKDRAPISIVGVGPAEPAPAEPSPERQGAKQKVWTSADVDRLREQGLISIIPTEPAPEQPAAPQQAAPPAAGAPPGVPPEEAYYDPFADPLWYAQQAYDLRVELAQRENALYQYEQNLALAKDATTQPGVNLFEGNVGITPEAGIQNLELQVQDVEIRLEKLRELARRNGIPPGVLRG